MYTGSSTWNEVFERAGRDVDVTLTERDMVPRVYHCTRDIYPSIYENYTKLYTNSSWSRNERIPVPMSCTQYRIAIKGHPVGVDRSEVSFRPKSHKIKHLPTEKAPKHPVLSLSSISLTLGGIYSVDKASVSLLEPLASILSPIKNNTISISLAWPNSSLYPLLTPWLTTV